MSLQTYLKNYATSNPSRWHTPGHTGTLDPLDITELVGCEQKIAELTMQAEQKCAAIYSAKKLRFLLNGSSIGIKAAILACDGDIIAFEGFHCALSEGAELAKVALHVVQREIGIDGLLKPPTANDVVAAIKKYPLAKAVFIESPDYYGRVVAREIADTIKNAGMYFFCDAAHGAHFIANKKLFPTGFESIADVCNLSAHKTLNAYTQTAYLTINNKNLFAPIDVAIKNLGTTSPNYVMLASLESALESAIKNTKEYEHLLKNVKEFKNTIPCLDVDDFTRIVVDAKALGYSGEELCKKLRLNHNIYAEKADSNYLIFIATPHKAKEDFTMLVDAIASQPSHLSAHYPFSNYA